MGSQFEAEVILKSVGHSFAEGSVNTDAYFSETDPPVEEGTPPLPIGVPIGRQGAYVHLDLTDNSSFHLEPGGKYRVTMTGPLD